MTSLRLSLVFLLLLPGVASAQRELATALVLRPDGGSGSCVVVEKLADVEDGWRGLAISAKHVTDGASNVQVKYENGRSCSRCAILATDSDSDLSVIYVWAPHDIYPVHVKPGEPRGVLAVFGYPAQRQDKLAGNYLRTSGESIYADIMVRPGFSGGGVFQGQSLVGCVSGGWFWTKDSDGRQATWPTRAGRSDAILELLKKAREAIQ